MPGVGSGRVCERGGASEGSSCVEAVLGKEIQLMHRAPVVSICVLDGRGKPLPDPYEASQDLAIAPDMTNAHSVLIASEEQLKVTEKIPSGAKKDEFTVILHPEFLPPGLLSPQSQRQNQVQADRSRRLPGEEGSPGSLWLSCSGGLQRTHTRLPHQPWRHAPLQHTRPPTSGRSESPSEYWEQIF